MGPHLSLDFRRLLARNPAPFFAFVQAGDHQAAVLEYNRVLTSYFDHGVAASAQYRLGRCFDALDRQFDATSAYQAVVSGYPLEPEAPAAAYLAMEGDSRMRATFDIGNFKKGLLMREVSPGNYVGEYRIVPGDKVRVELSPYDLTKGRITFRYK